MIKELKSKKVKLKSQCGDDEGSNAGTQSFVEAKRAGSTYMHVQY